MNPITDYKVNYVQLSNCIRKAAIQGKGIDFTFDFEKLNESVADMNLLVVPNDIKSKRIGPEDIVFLGEFFKKYKLTWLDHFKFYSSLVFVRTDVEGALDEEFWELMEQMKANQMDNPDIDKAEVLGKILVKYPCYVSAVVSYKNADIKHFGTISFEIVSKANLVTITIDNNKYYAPQNTENNSEGNSESTATEENNTEEVQNG